jgi:hypothetical protein
MGVTGVEISGRARCETGYDHEYVS